MIILSNNTSINSKRNYAFGEEIANAITHFVFAIILLIATPLLAVLAYEQTGNALISWSFVIFTLSNFGMFVTSALYHSSEFDSKHRDVYKKLDHIFIYVAIAGTYTPLVITNIEGGLAIFCLVAQWGTVLFGVLYKTLKKDQSPKVSLTIYLLMGWMAIILIPQILATQNLALMFWMLTGGLFYTFGTIFFVMHHIKWMHSVWHIFVGLGSMSFLIAISFFAI